ncbi:glycosyltransferase family 2 protein [Leeuwenhoekiella polynyae]|uniref:Glycosyltransferase involved in cell wall biosynthesis n=1 Tax=Leeuwenhoekiella polynyae TaxID=1550906 RepID=A0A4Q0PGN4_9FLAO|nr:glycosyltransferase family 2 protein [Leeuwenhoekiella polynyae]RXG26139.1 glycosyltransferase involved in cell wall biosynthesis [Leeuwenhoekiella polynyae]
MPEISVVIPVFNKAAYLQETIQSVLAQRFTDFELILINDGSTDNSLEILHGFSDVRIRIIDQENQGLSQTRNTGVLASQADFIALLDADDIWLPDHLDVLIKLRNSFPEADLFGTGYEEFYSTGKLLKPRLNLKIKEAHLVTDYFDTSLYQPLIIPSGMAFTKVGFLAIEGFKNPITYSEDVDFLIQANLNFRLAYNPKITCRYRSYVPNQISSQKKSELQAPKFGAILRANPEHQSLHKYIQFKRYFLCIFYKTEGRLDLFSKLKKKLDPSVLNKKQRFLLNAPRLILIVIRKAKLFLLRRGFRFTAF